MYSYSFKTYNELFDFITTTYTNPNFLNYLENGTYKSISVNEFKEKVICLAIALKKMGINKGDTIAIFAKSSPFWLIFDFAIHKIGAISVPIFDNISTQNLNFEIEDAKIKYVFIDSIERLDDIKHDVTFITHNFCIKEEGFHNLDDIFVMSTVKCDIYDLEQNTPKEEDTFSIIYTSGNTGTPKGVQLTHKNIINQIHDVNKILELPEDEVILSLLPLAHIFERMVMSFYLNKGVSIYFVDEIPNVSNLLKVVRPTMMTVVPRLLEKIFFKIKMNIDAKPFISRFIAKKAFNYALNENMNKETFLFKVFNKIVYSKLRDIFGGRITKLVSGGAPLNKEIAQFFLNIGIPIYQGYGLTESSPVITTNIPGANKVGSSGRPIPSVEVKITNDGELLARGDSIMKGYLNNDELTAKTIDKDGWLYTGDLASIDEDGYVYIQSRKKDIYKLSTGNYVSTIPIEQALSKNKYIEFATIIANNKKYVSCLLFIDKDIYNNDILNKQLTIEEYYNQDKVHKSIKNDIKIINKNVNEWEKIIQYTIVTNDISIEGGELTPSMKICRNVIEEKYEEVINKMY
ncbi:long-chain fatty acid--CoA ligase [Arcobacter sp. LA11]|uniref:AMP-dependent synthetase/ligase n=1 Tax=Arcobacter sp. LA11 TaxID=1898176 RepID=UPI00093247C2|nr:long-chain fatty acid--CoA ligase [Arcobacter sp. LA11]